MSNVETTQYGFYWNAATVTRLAEMPNGTICLGIKGSGNQGIEVYVSAHGRSVRVFRHGVELTEGATP